MTRSNALKIAQKKYHAKLHGYLIRFNDSEKFLLDYIKNKKPSANKYIKNLIKNDYETN